MFFVWLRVAQVADEALGHRAGNLVFIIETLPHPDFTRRNDDLHMDLDIPLIDALVRYFYTVPSRSGFMLTATTVPWWIGMNPLSTITAPYFFGINYLKFELNAFCSSEMLLYHRV